MDCFRVSSSSNLNNFHFSRQELVSHRLPIEVFHLIVLLALNTKSSFNLHPKLLKSDSKSQALPISLLSQVSTALSFSLISNHSRKISQELLFKSPVLDRDNAESFKNVLMGNERLRKLVKSLTFGTRKSKGFGQHEHVQLKTVLEILDLTKQSVETVMLDMTCGAVGCDGMVVGKLDWSSREGGEGSSSGDNKLELPNLKRLGLRCPFGYLPPGIRSLLQNHLSLPKLSSLNLLFTQPGNFRITSRTSYRLTNILELVPSISYLDLRLVESGEESSSGFLSPKLVEVQLPASKEARSSCSSSEEGKLEINDQKEWIKTVVEKSVSKLRPQAEVKLLDPNHSLEQVGREGETFNVSFQSLVTPVGQKLEPHSDDKWNELVAELVS